MSDNFRAVAGRLLYFVLGGLVFLLFAGCSIQTPGNGEKIGQVVRLSKSGIFCKTWEAQLIRGGMSGGSGSFGVQPFDFTIEDDSTAARVTEYMRNQTEVTITYRTEGIASNCRSGSGGHFLTSVVPAAASR